ncbi:MAG: TlpA family protein disulfide reductase [Streptosporangiaceae bacterium]
MRAFRISYPSLSDTDGEIALGFRHTGVPDVLPDTVIISRAGRIAATIIGGATYGRLMALIANGRAARSSAGRGNRS